MPVAPEVVLSVVCAVNVVTFLTFGYDKRCARLQRSRIPEAWLLGLSFATGLVGGWVGMSVFRHKTQKRSFQVKMVLVSIVNLAWPLFWLAWNG